MDIKLYIAQLEAIIASHKLMVQNSQYDDLSDLPKADRQSLVTRAIASIHRVTGVNSTYSKEIERILEALPSIHKHTSSIIGITQALKEDLELGYIQSLVEIVHSEIFSDFLDMARHLNNSGYKDSSAVLAGSTLESHLRKLALKNSIEVEKDDRPIKANKLNADLTKSDVYGLLDQKNITAWLDLRNKAAHGNYEEYTKEQVDLLIAGIQDFITRNRA
ncbi:hypothetical protein [Labilibaculum manganireducens]|uniref:hypothetical protein n=1 Tax=Labilibaculum manganireducens TaxID=1940525 RepID=UPI0029F5AB1C|nr:hypothetical protein [Labilibaculum manganireducens]